MSRRMLQIIIGFIALAVFAAGALLFMKATTPPPATHKTVPVKVAPVKKVVAPALAPATKQPAPQVIINNYNMQNGQSPSPPSSDPASIIINNYNIQGSAPTPTLTPAPVQPQVQPPAEAPQAPYAPMRQDQQAANVRPPAKVVNVLSGNSIQFRVEVLSGWGGTYGYGGPPPLYQRPDGTYGTTPGVLVCDRYQGCTWR